jgi:hypothetical protein
LRNDHKGRTSQPLDFYPIGSRPIGETFELGPKNNLKGQTRRPSKFHTRGNGAWKLRTIGVLPSPMAIRDDLEVESLPGLEIGLPNKGKGKDVDSKHRNENLERFRGLVGIGSGKDVEAGRPPRV